MHFERDLQDQQDKKKRIFYILKALKLHRRSRYYRRLHISGFSFRSRFFIIHYDATSRYYYQKLLESDGDRYFLKDCLFQLPLPTNDIANSVNGQVDNLVDNYCNLVFVRNYCNL